MITLNQHRENITKKIIGRFSDTMPVKPGLSIWFPSETTAAKQVSIEVERNAGLIAVDVERGTEGNLNTFGKSTEKIYIPPYFNEMFNFSDLDVYQRTFGQGVDPRVSDYKSMILTANTKLNILRNKIERAKQLQRAQALQTGIVTMKNGDSVDFKRKASSIVDLGSGSYFGESGVDILKTIAEGINFIKRDGKSASSQFDLIIGSRVLPVIQSDDAILKQLDNRNVSIGSLGSRFNDVSGLHFHGQLTTRNGVVNLWSYEDYYEERQSNGTLVQKEYIDDDKIILLPKDFIGKHAHAGVPAIIRDKSNAEFPDYIRQMEAEYYTNNYIDPRSKAHMFEIMSAPLAIPFSVDRVWTAKALADV